jgi:hypothetical protein
MEIVVVVLASVLIGFLLCIAAIVFCKLIMEENDNREDQSN